MKKRVSRFWVKKLLALVFLLTLTGMTGLFATPITILVNSPKLGGDNPLKEQIQNEIDRIITLQMKEFQNAVLGINGYPQELIGAFASSSVFSSTGASLRAYQGYDAFSFTLGAMGGVQTPGNPFAWIFGLGDELFNVLDVFERTGDIQAGVNPQILNAQLGINTAKFLQKGLYVGLKGGLFNLNLPFNDYSFSFRTWSIGGLINYQVIPQKRFSEGVIVWRGLNIGTGFIYQKTNLIIGLPLFPDGDNVTFPIYGGIRGEIRNAKFKMVFNVNTFTVPLEAVTSIRLLGFVNASLGAGVDFGFGNAGLEGDPSGATIHLYGFPNSLNLYQEKEGSFSVTMGGEMSPEPVNPKVMASIGFSAGPAILLDIPITYYFRNNGYNIGITFGIAL